MKLFKGHKENEIKVDVGDRILRRIVVKRERKWFEEEHPLWHIQERLIIESVVKEVSPSGDYYCLTEKGEDIWVRGEALVVLEVLDKDQRVNE